MTKSHDRPFVIEWDATDLASFEAKAQRDVVFVRYEGCHLSVLYECSDDSLPGKLGAYGPPLRTSGTVEAVDIEDQGRLYAELPLAAASLSGRVESGDKFHMRYFVSGVVQATRGSVARPSLAGIAACAGATHFVWAYDPSAARSETAKTRRCMVRATARRTKILPAGGPHSIRDPGSDRRRCGAA